MGQEVRALVLRVLGEAGEPLQTKEVVERVSMKMITSRTVVFRILNVLRGDGKIKGKFVGPGKGVWIWWRNGGFG